MMIISYRDRNTDMVTKISWELGDPTPLVSYAPDEVFEVEANDDELSYVLLRFSGLRSVRRAEITRWYGDDAKFIAGNLL